MANLNEQLNKAGGVAMTGMGIVIEVGTAVKYPDMTKSFWNGGANIVTDALTLQWGQIIPHTIDWGKTVNTTIENGPDGSLVDLGIALINIGSPILMIAGVLKAVRS